MPLEQPLFNEQQITNKRVILGLLREAYFLRSNILISQKGQDYTGKVIQFLEKDLRSSDEVKKLSIQLDFITSTLLCSESVIRIAFPKFIIYFDAQVAELSGNKILITSPDFITLKQLRAYSRKKIENTTFQPLLCKSNETFEVGFQLKDISNLGIGGILKMYGERPPSLGLQFEGRYYIDKTELKINATLTRIEASDIQAPDGTFYYNIGLQNKTTSKTQKNIPKNNSEARQIFRFAIEDTIKIENLALSNLPIPIKIGEASFLGFSGKLADNAVLPLPLGFTFSLSDTTLKFSLTSEFEGMLRFVLEDGSQEDRLKWAKYISRTTFKDISTSTPESDELLNLFCEAGAMAPELMEKGSLYASEFLIPLARESDDTFWVFRWINTSLDSARKHIRGHMSGIRYGDNAWFVGETAGGASPDRKIESTFVARFFSSFKDFALSQTPCPKVFFVWKRGHPYWHDFEQHIFKSENASLLEAWVKIAHTKISYLKNTSEKNEFNSRELDHRDHSKIISVINDLKSNATDRFAGSFDFSPDKYASPVLRTQFLLSNSEIFKRSYVEFYTESESYLVIFTKLPFGSSFNQVMTSAFVFSLRSAGLNEQLWQNLKNRILEYGLSHGIPPSSIRRIIGSKDSETLLSDESNLVDGFLIHPKLIGFYDTWRTKT
jgi:hypothetical protein